MEIIGVLQGMSAYREIQEEYIPERQAPLQDIIQVVRTAYQFQHFPVFGPNAPASVTLNFSQGRFVKNEMAFGITQLLMTPKGDAVVTTNTDQSDLALEHLLELLDTKFGYRLRQSSKTKIYWSHVVVEFDDAIEKYITKIGAIERTISQKVGNNRTFKFKGMAFGTSTAAKLPGMDMIDMLDAQEFLIERRVDIPFEKNRFFCSAPLNTISHIEALREIESTLRT